MLFGLKKTSTPRSSRGTGLQATSVPGAFVPKRTPMSRKAGPAECRPGLPGRIAQCVSVISPPLRVVAVNVPLIVILSCVLYRYPTYCSFRVIFDGLVVLVPFTQVH